MKAESPLKNKTILVVDDEPDVLTTVAEILDVCRVETGRQFRNGPAVDYEEHL